MNETEQKALFLLKGKGYQNIQQLDWIGKKNDKWVIFEIKERELFTPPPFLGTGLDIRQIYLRNKLLEDTGIRTVLIVYIKNSNDIYYAYLDKLEAGEHFDTKNDIRIYPITNYEKLS